MIVINWRLHISMSALFKKTSISVMEFQKNLEKQRNIIFCCHKRYLCKICIEVQFPVAGAPMVQIHLVLVFLILDPLLRNCRGGTRKGR